MPTNYLPSAAEYLRILPELILVISATLIMLLEGIRGRDTKPSSLIPGLTLLALIAALGATFVAFANGGAAFQQMLLVDGFATFFRALVIVVGLLVFLTSGAYLRRRARRSR